MHILHLSHPSRLNYLVALTLLLAFTTITFSSLSLAAGGPGDGTTSSSWMEDKRMLKALSFISNKKHRDAVKILTALVADKPDFANAWNYLGFSLRKIGAYERSEKAYLTALRLDPNHRGAHEYLAELYLQTSRRKKALELERSLTRICQYGCPELDELREVLKEQ